MGFFHLFESNPSNDKEADYEIEAINAEILKYQTITKYQTTFVFNKKTYHNAILENGTFVTYSDDGHALIIRYPAIQINETNQEKDIVWRCFSIPEDYMPDICK